MRTAGRILLWVVLSVLALTAYDSLVIHPAGRYQIATGEHGTFKLDSTTGQTWRFNYQSETWEQVDVPVRPK